MKPPRAVGISLLLLSLGVAGYWIAKSAEVSKRSAPKPVVSVPVIPEDGGLVRKYGSGSRGELPIRLDEEALEKGALAGQRSLVFKDRESMERFLSKLQGKGIAVLGRIDALNALRVGFLNSKELASLLDGSEEMGYLFPISVPGLPEGTIQPGAVPLGNGLLDWLGVAGYERSDWGNGVKVAVLDTGVSPTASFASRVKQLSMVEMPSDLSNLNGHGTAVSSLILDVAPGASILSIRVADDNGASNSFLIAQGIIAAVDGGAGVINISMGGDGYSMILANAVKYAQERGVVVVAASGNNGIGQIAQPAALPGVVSVGAVDANGDHLLFSNSGTGLGASAPGYAVTAEGTDGSMVSFSGTSASTPIYSGAVAAAMNNGVLKSQSATGAADLVAANLNEAGQAGADNYFGGGLVNLGRVMQSHTAGIVDAAVASQYVASGTNGLNLEVTVQNQGTTNLFNVPLQVTTANGTQSMNVGSLAPGAIRTFTVAIPQSTSPLTFQSVIGVSSGQSDANPANNRRIDVYTPASSR